MKKVAKFKWNSKEDELKEEKKLAEKHRFKGKKFETLSRKEKDELLYILLEERGLI